MSDIFNLKDSLGINDKLSVNKQKSGIWARTEIIGGYDRYQDSHGVSQLGEVVFKSENMVLIGGIQYAMERLFNVTGPLSVPKLNDSGIGSTSAVVTPAGLVYPAAHAICLFGVGVGGAGSSTTSVLDVNYKSSGLTSMVPLRYTNTTLGASDAAKYFGKKSVNGTTAYYLKKFDSNPTIKFLWEDGVGDADGTVVDSSVFTSQSTVGIDSFTEIVMSISVNDVKEWFNASGDIEDSRINELALFTGVFNSVTGDYSHLMAFSKLNIPTEPLSLSKELSLIYRVFGS